MSVAKLIALFQTGGLYLSRIDLLQDSHEGSIPKLLAEARNTGIGAADSRLRSALSGVSQQVCRACYVNCWTISQFESEAFWRMYTRDDDGVAIRTSYKKLIEAIEADDELLLGRISYLDYETQWFPDGNLYYPVMHKRLAFAHEREVRFVKMLYAHVSLDGPEGPPGILVPVNLERLVENIFVTPYAQEWLLNVVSGVVAKFAPSLVDRVRWSRMKSVPLY